MSKHHYFEYEYNNEKFDAVLIEDLKKEAREPVKSQETDHGTFALITINADNPSKYEFQYCDCGQKH